MVSGRAWLRSWTDGVLDDPLGRRGGDRPAGALHPADREAGDDEERDDQAAGDRHRPPRHDRETGEAGDDGGGQDEHREHPTAVAGGAAGGGAGGDRGGLGRGSHGFDRRWGCDALDGRASTSSSTVSTVTDVLCRERIRTRSEWPSTSRSLAISSWCLSALGIR